MNQFPPHDVTIIGAGPAGLSAFLWCIQLGLRPFLLEKKDEVGGQLSQIYKPLEDYLGFYGDGKALIKNWQEKIAPFQSFIKTGIEVIKITANGLETRQGIIESKAKILCPGLRLNRLKVADDLGVPTKNFLRYSYTEDPTFFSGSSTVVVGSGDGAIENALYLAEQCPQVYILSRSSRLKCRSDFYKKLQLKKNVKILLSTELKDLEINAHGELESIVTNNQEKIKVSKILVKIGFTPNTEFLAKEIRLSPAGYIPVDVFKRTQYPYTWAIGDAINEHYPSLSLSVGDASVAVKNIRETISPIENNTKTS